MCADSREATYLNLQSEYLEELEVGYRWYDANNVSPHFAFGHGLSYTTFEYGDATVSVMNVTGDGSVLKNDVVATVSVDITNVGAVMGHEVAQL